MDHIYADYEHPWTLVAAISGVHTVGKASLENSGYEGHWSSAEEQGKFNNDYYKSALYRGWGPHPAVNNNTNKNQWEIVDWGAEEEHTRFMLNSDLCLVYNSNKRHERCSRAYPKSTEDWRDFSMRVSECDANLIDKYGDLDPNVSPKCCAWAHVNHLRYNGVKEFNTVGYEFCGK